MIVWDSGLGMRVGRFSTPLRREGVITMPDVELDSPRCIEVPPGPGVPQLRVPGLAVRVFIDLCCFADGVVVMC